MHRVLGITAVLAAAGLLLATGGTVGAQPADEQKEAAEEPKEGTPQEATAGTEDEAAADEGAAEEAEAEAGGEDEAEAGGEDEAEAEGEDEAEAEGEDEDEEIYDDEAYSADLDDEAYAVTDEDMLEGAEAATAETEEADRPAGQVGLELGTYFRSDDVGSTLELAPLLSAWVGVGHGVELVLDWGIVAWSFAPESGESSDAFGLGNPFFGVRRGIQADRSRFHFGIGIAAPASFVPEERDPDSGELDPEYAELEAAYETAWAIHGMWNPWLWMPEHFSFAIPLDASMVSEHSILLGGEAAFAVMIPVDNYRSTTAEIVLQLAGEVGFGFEDMVETGIRVQGVALPVAEGDRLQMGFGPFVRTDLGGGYFNARLILNLDKAYGFFGGADIWGLHLGGGLDL